MLQLQKNLEFLNKAKVSRLDLGERLKLARIVLRKSQKEFSEVLKCSRATLSAYEMGSRKPKKDFLNLCAEIYNINPKYLTKGIEPMFLKEQIPLIKIEVIDKEQNALIDKAKEAPNAGIKQSEMPQLDTHNDKTQQLNKEETIEGEAYSEFCLDDELNQALLPTIQNPSYNVFNFKNLELDIIVYESKIYYSFAHISKIVGLHLMSDLMFCMRTFSQDELKKASFRTFKELDTYYKDEVYVEYKAFAACYKGHKNKDIVAFLEYAKHLESNLVQYYSQNVNLEGEYNITLFEKMYLGKIRVKGDSENPLFCLSDVCGILELEGVNKVANAIKREFEVGELNSHPLQTVCFIRANSFLTLGFFILFLGDK